MLGDSPVFQEEQLFSIPCKAGTREWQALELEEGLNISMRTVILGLGSISLNPNQPQPSGATLAGMDSGLASRRPKILSLPMPGSSGWLLLSAPLLPRPTTPL